MSQPSAERFARLKALLAEAVDLPPAEREAHLRRAGGGDEDLASEALELLGFDAGDLDGDQAGATPEERALHALVGQTIGPYRLLAVIGDGGMGTVFLAEQTRPIARRVALKIIKLGLDTGEVVARFESERQALAMMSHPNIARVLDAGATDTGRPYFVMEHIDGVPLTRFCRERGLGLEERLRLLVQVCRGIHHAHQRGVIHRDIKPGNVLVTLEDDRPVAKIIDFGVAKAMSRRLTERTMLTRYGILLGTPEYMSPEQAGAQDGDIDTRCDVYALGVLLYELATGSLPIAREEFRRAGLLKIHQTLLEREPPPPSARLVRSPREGAGDLDLPPPARRAWIARVRGDLDWVTMKALEKDRARRYDSAAALADELERFVARRPVEAGPPSRWYRARRFVRRHRAVVLSVGLILTTLLAGIVGTTAGMVRAGRAEQEALRAARQAEAGRLFELARSDDRPYRAQAALLRAIELDDRPEYRRQVRFNLLREPPLFRLPPAPGSHNPHVINFSPDGRWLAVGWARSGSLQLYPLAGGEPIDLAGHRSALRHVRFTSDSRRLVTAGSDSTLRVWDPETARQVDLWRLASQPQPFLCRGDSLLIVREVTVGAPVRWWRRPLAGGAPVLLGETGDPVVKHQEASLYGVDAAGRRLATHEGERVLLYDVEDLGRGPLYEVGRHERTLYGVVFSPGGDQLLSYDAEGTLRLWDLADASARLAREFRSRPEPYHVRFSRDGRWLAASSTSGFHVWDLWVAAPTMPRILRGTSRWCFDADFHPTLPWLVTTHAEAMAAVRSIAGWQRTDLPLPEGDTWAVLRFSRDGRWLVGASDTGTVMAWPLEGRRIGEPRHLAAFPGYRHYRARIDDASEACYLTVCNTFEGRGLVTRVPLDGGEPRSWHGASCTLEISRDGRFAGTGGYEGSDIQHARVLDLVTDSAIDLAEPDGGALRVVGFLPDDRIVGWGSAGLGLWNTDGSGFVRLAERPVWAALSRDRRTVVYLDQAGLLWRRAAVGGEREALAAHPLMPSFLDVVLDETGARLTANLRTREMIFADLDRGFLQRLPLADERVVWTTVDPLGRWIAGSHHGMITLLPVPVEPLPMDLPHDEYLAWLSGLGNLRVVDNAQSDVGFDLVGWSVPDWSRPPRW